MTDVEFLDQLEKAPCFALLSAVDRDRLADLVGLASFRGMIAFFDKNWETYSEQDIIAAARNRLVTRVIDRLDNANNEDRGDRFG